jgi:hypothetical protein
MEESWQKQKYVIVVLYSTYSFLISNFRRVLNVVCFLLGNSPASEVYMPTFRNTLFHIHRQVDVCRMNWVRGMLVYHRGRGLAVMYQNSSNPVHSTHTPT